MDQKAIGLILGALILGAVGGYFVGGSQGGQLQSQLASLTSQVSSLQSQVTSLQTQITTLQSDKTALQGQITSLQADKTRLQGQVTSLQTNYSRLATENAALRLNITNTMAELTRLRAIHTYSVGSTIATLSGGETAKTGPAFYFTGGNLKITAVLQATDVTFNSFTVYLYRVGGSIWVSYGTTDSEGTFETYAYGLSSGDYYIKISSINFNWQVTVQVYA